jgi:hypothetical protein
MSPETNKSNGDQGGTAPRQPSPLPTLGKPYMDHRVLTREIKPASTNPVRSGSS